MTIVNGSGSAGASSCPVLDHGAFGNGRVLGLVAPTGAMEWLCLPSFDSPSVFGRLLDRDRGGTWVFLRGDREIRGHLEYVPNTNVLSTVFSHHGAEWEQLDFAPRIPDGWKLRLPIEVVRLLVPRRGAPRLRMLFDPRPNYARAPADMHETTDGVVVLGQGAPLYLHTNLPTAYVLERREFVLDRPLYFVFAYGDDGVRPELFSVRHALDETAQGWRLWAKSCALPTFAADHVLRSALCLKLHINEPTGAVIAAATTSIPEALGTGRSWDYRYCWLRDAAFVVEALRRLSHMGDGERFLRYLRNVAEEGPLQPVYGIGGRRDLHEEILPHLAGFGGHGPVRIGNAAYNQKQNDLMGELLLCLDTILGDPRVLAEEPREYLPLIERLVEDAIAAAPTPDTGIWEFRTLLRPYTLSRAMCWAAIHRGAGLARRLGRTDLAERWTRIATSEAAVVLDRGFNRRLGFFTQTLDGEQPDASNLLLPTLGLIDARDEQFRSTLDAYDRLLLENGLVLRYRNEDDFGETTSAFTVCSFWRIEALALAGRLDDAIHEFNRLIGFANPLGLFSEDIDPQTGRLLGNFPQAYTHVGLIHAAMTIDGLVSARDGRVRAWV